MPRGSAPFPAAPADRKLIRRRPRPRLNEDDRRLVDRARGGDRAAFGELVDRYRGRVYALAVSILGGSHDDAVALTRETFVEAWASIPALARPERFPSWLSRIAYRAGAERRREPASGPPAPPSGGQERELLEALLASLPETQRVALDLRFRERIGYAEIGETLDMSEAAVRSAIGKGMQVLRSKLEPFLRRRLKDGPA